MMFKQIFALGIAAVLTVAGFNAIAQDNTTIDQRLFTKFSEDELSEMQTDRPEELAYWNAVAADGYRIEENTKEGSEMEEIELNLWKLPNFNMFEYDLEPQATFVQTYRIKGTDKYLMILSEKKIKALMKF